MTTDIKDNLFVLIKSLTKSEKRQFKLYVGRMDSNEDSKFLNLFNLLDKMRKYDEKKIIESNIVTKQQLSNLKVFSGNEHNLEAQKPEVLDFASLNRKNKFN